MTDGDDVPGTPVRRLDRIGDHLRTVRDDVADDRPEIAALLDDALDDVTAALDRLQTEQCRLDGDLDALFDALGDADCRAILLATDEPRTARELVDRCHIPRSTAYRKLDRLTDAGLLEETVRVSADGNHPAAYVRRVDRLWIPTDGTRELQVTAPSPTSRDRGGQAADAERDASSAAGPFPTGSAERSGVDERHDLVPNPLGAGASDLSR